MFNPWTSFFPSPIEDDLAILHGYVLRLEDELNEERKFTRQLRDALADVSKHVDLLMKKVK